MISNQDVAIIPSRSGLLNREWVLTIAILIVSGIVWGGIIYHSSRTNAADPSQHGTTYSQAPDTKELEVTFLDVGEGDSIFLRTPHGRTILIDAGPGKGQYSDFDAGEKVVIPFLESRNIQRIDTLVMTHPHADHIGGILPVANKFAIGECLDPGLDYETAGYEKILTALLERKIRYQVITAPQILDWDKDMLVQVLWPEDSPNRPKDPNNNSIVLRVVYGDVVYLLTGDIETNVEQELYAYGKKLRTTILKVPHHGSQTSSSRQLLEYLMPRLAIFSLGLNNKFDHPDATIVNLYEEMKIKSLRTDRSGTIRTLCNGKRIKVAPEIGNPFTIYPFPSAEPEASPDV